VTATPPDDLEDRLGAVRRRIAAAGGDPARVAVVAVTKGFGPAAVEAAARASLDVGENYAQELVAKQAELAGTPGAADVRWHFLGAVQRNKVRRLAPVVSVWQALVRAVEGEEIARAAPGTSVLVEVLTAPGSGRNGVPPRDVAPLVGQLRALDLDVRGLMTVAPQDPAAARAGFAAVTRLADELGLAERSMGMTGDLELAVAEGSTMVRVGRALFGDRPTRRAP